MASRTCEICRVTYVEELADDRAYHRKHHARAMKALQPRPLSRFLKRLKDATDPVHVNALSARWLQDELYVRARMFKRELGYDFPQWSPYGDEQPDAHGFLLCDDTGTFGHGAIAGGCVFRWREWSNRPHGWTMDWVWLAPEVRRRGLLARRWGTFEKRFGRFYLRPPKQFAEKVGWLSTCESGGEGRA